MQVNPGDYLITTEKALYRIMDVYEDATTKETFYDIKSLRPDSLTLQDSYGSYCPYIFNTKKGLTNIELLSLGRVISQNLITKAEVILYAGEVLND